MSALREAFTRPPVFEERHGAYGISRDSHDPECPYVVFEWGSGDERDECSTVTEARERVARYRRGDALFASAARDAEDGCFTGPLDQLARGEE